MRPQPKYSSSRMNHQTVKGNQKGFDTITKQRNLVRARKIQYQRQGNDSIIFNGHHKTLSKYPSHSSH